MPAGRPRSKRVGAVSPNRQPQTALETRQIFVSRGRLTAIAVLHEGQPFLAFNGIQTQSARSFNLGDKLDELPQLGVNVVRISPLFENTFEVVNLFRQRLERSITADRAARQLENLMPRGACNGYWHGQPGLNRVAAAN